MQEILKTPFFCPREKGWEELSMMPALDQSKELRVLVVDSSPNSLRGLVIGLGLEGFAVTGCGAGGEALELVEKEHFDVALVEVMLPQINGLKLVRELRAKKPGLVTLLMSAYHLSPTQLSRACTGALGFVPKPYNFGKLVHFIKQKARPTEIPSSPPDTSAVETVAPFDIPLTLFSG